MTELISARGISKIYGSAKVLDSVDFDLQAGEVHALLGGNGAGKSTLMRILSGLTSAESGNGNDAGQIFIGGQKLVHASPAEAQRLGLYLVPQEAQLFPNQDVLQNICIGLPQPAAHYRARIEQLIKTLGLALPLDKRAATLEIADRQLVEVLRGLIRDARVLILDEPTAALTPFEVAALFKRVRALRDTGVGIVFISHKLHELRAIADRITILRDGKRVFAGDMAATSDEQILQAMSPGLSATRIATTHARKAGENRLSVRDLAADQFAGISLDLHAGEIVGLAGVVGAGRTEFAEVLVGLHPASQGSVQLNGRMINLANWNIRAAVDAGMVLLSEDRGSHGLFLEAPLHANMLSFLVHRLPLMLRPAKDRQQFETYRSQMSIRCSGPDQTAGTLSGGNQQKVLLAKCLATEPSVLILDEPTRGVDAGARADIYALIRAAAAKGTAILMISSDFEEITLLSDRILVMAAGHLAGELPAGASAEQIGALAFESRHAAPDEVQHV